MGIVLFDISMSLDGFITAANPRPEAGLGDDGERLHDWVFNSDDPRDREITEKYARMGANIFGRATYDLAISQWGADGPTSRARIPTVIVSHSIPQNVPENHVYSFVDGIEAALETAKKLAGDQDIYITGADVARQFLERGLIDEVFIHLIPVLFGSGTRLFEGREDEHISLEILETIQTAKAVHMRFRVMR